MTQIERTIYLLINQHLKLLSNREILYGENIFWGKGRDYSALDASKGWYSEIEHYTHGVLNSSNWSKTGHYTQMVWKSTTQVGIAVAKCSNGAIIIVANYNPGGNYMGESPY